MCPLEMSLLDEKFNEVLRLWALVNNRDKWERIKTVFILCVVNGAHGEWCTSLQQQSEHSTNHYRYEPNVK